VAHGSGFPGSTSTAGRYDFSEEKLQDNVGIRPPNWTPLKRSKIWGCETRVMCFSHQDLSKTVGLTYFVDLTVAPFSKLPRLWSPFLHKLDISLIERIPCRSHIL